MSDWTQHIPAIALAATFIWGSGFITGWNVGRRVTNYMLGGKS
jgi:hypothetical protein